MIPILFGIIILFILFGTDILQYWWVVILIIVIGLGLCAVGYYLLIMLDLYIDDNIVPALVMTVLPVIAGISYLHDQKKAAHKKQ